MAASESVASALAPKKSTAAAANATGATTNSSTSTSDTADITSSDFLTLLVSELQNQDPTQPADPNAYITQLVGVNSLQQLISINQGITGLDSAVTPPASASDASTANALLMSHAASESNGASASSGTGGSGATSSGAFNGTSGSIFQPASN
jgi:flagellar basal-body rod modification protein FlgD